MANAAAAVLWPLGKPRENPLGRGRPTRTLKPCSISDDPTRPGPQSPQCRRAARERRYRSRVAGRSTCQVPAWFATFANRYASWVSCSRRSWRTARSPGRRPVAKAATLRPRKAPSVIRQTMRQFAAASLLIPVAASPTAGLQRAGTPDAGRPPGELDPGAQSEQSEAERADDGGPGGKIERRRRHHGPDADERPERPADGEAGADAVRQDDAGQSGHDEVREHQQDAGDPHRGGHDDAERGGEKEVPPSDAPALTIGGAGVRRDEEEGLPAEPVEEADDGVEAR